MMNNVVKTSPGLMFTREDLSKPENRANQWLLAACCADSVFRVGVLKLLGLNYDSILRPIQHPGFRPDLTVFQDGDAVAIIECEAGGIDIKQASHYKSLGLDLFWVVGKAGLQEKCTTWHEIGVLAHKRRLNIDEQVAVALDLLIGAIQDIEGMNLSKVSWIQVPDDLPELLKSEKAFEPLLRLPEGIIGAWRFAQGSASLRLLKPAAALRTGPNGVGLAMTQAGKPGIVVLPAAGHLRKKLDIKFDDWIDEWTDLMARLAPNAAASGSSAKVSIGHIEKWSLELHSVWNNLAERLLAWPP